MESTSWLLLDLEALPASLLLRFGAIITVNKGFLNTNIAITWQLIWTARTLEAEWWQVNREAWVWEQRKMSHILGAFGLLDFTMLRPVLAWRAFWNLWKVYFFNFPFFLAAMNHGYGVPHVYEVCPENSRIYRVKRFQSYLEAIQPCRLQSTPLYSVCTAASVSSMFWSIPGKLF